MKNAATSDQRADVVKERLDPSDLLKLLLGEMFEMLLTGQNVYPKKLLDTGFKFKYPSLEPALKELLL